METNNRWKVFQRGWISFETIKLLVITAAIVVPFRLWVAQPFIVSGASMEPTYHNGDYLIIDEISYAFRGPKKNEVIVFRYPLNPSQFFIKRVSGLPRDTAMTNKGAVQLATDEYYVLGDNSAASYDSRMWGAVPKNMIVGRVLVRLWSMEKMKALVLGAKELLGKFK